MARVPQLKPEQLTEGQRKLAAGLGATRGGGLAVNGPWGLLLRNEKLCDIAGQFGTMLRDATSVPKNLSELAIAVTARFWTAQFEWNAHAPQALRAGVAPDIIEAIRQRRRPAFTRKDEEAVYDYVTELYEKKKVSDKTYNALREHVSAEQAIELTSIAGFYATVAMLIVAFEVDLPAGVQPPLPT
jgi:4-carboxymuconolactone decarboxylase